MEIEGAGGLDNYNRNRAIASLPALGIGGGYLVSMAGPAIVSYFGLQGAAATTVLISADVAGGAAAAGGTRLVENRLTGRPAGEGVGSSTLKGGLWAGATSAIPRAIGSVFRLRANQIQARNDQGQVNALVKARVDAGKARVGDATSANVRSGEGTPAPAAQSNPTTGVHAEPQVVNGAPTGQTGPRTIAVDQKPCQGCRELLTEKLGPGDRVLVTQDPTAPNLSPKSAAVNAANGDGTVIPKVVYRVPEPQQSVPPLLTPLVDDKR